MCIIQNCRFRKMMDEVLECNNPEKAHDLFTEFLGDDFEKEGRIKYKGLDVKYYVGYTEYNREIILNLMFKDIKDRNDDPVWELKMRFKRENITRLFNDLKALIRMVQ